MLQHYLQNAVKDLQSLIEITQSDIDDIKQAKHDVLFSRVKTKEELISSFENKKALIDNEIAKLARENSGKSLEELLPEPVRNLLDDMKSSLSELKKLNKHYARMVLAVSEFYNSLLERLVPTESNGYEGKKRAASSFLKVNV